MRGFLLAAAVLLACSGSSIGQNLPPDYLWEIGVNAGYSTFTRPLGPLDAYQGTRTNISQDYSLRLNYYASPNWMIHLDFGTRQWISYGQWKQTGLLGQALPPQPITFLVADYAINESVGLSYVIPYYTKYNTFNRANLYFGVNVGLMNVLNDGSMRYSKYGKEPYPDYTYLSGYNYGHGMGYNFGVQVGYTYYIVPRLGVNIDLGLRYASIKTNDEHLNGANAKYRTLYFPETLGLRWRF